MLRILLFERSAWGGPDQIPYRRARFRFAHDAFIRSETSCRSAALMGFRPVLVLALDVGSDGLVVAPPLRASAACCRAPISAWSCLIWAALATMAAVIWLLTAVGYAM